MSSSEIPVQTTTNTSRPVPVKLVLLGSLTFVLDFLGYTLNVFK